VDLKKIQIYIIFLFKNLIKKNYKKKKFNKKNIERNYFIIQNNVNNILIKFYKLKIKYQSMFNKI